MLEDICEWKQDQHRNTRMIHGVGGEDKGAGFVHLGEKKAKRDIIAYLLRYYCSSSVTYWVVAENRVSHSSFLELHSDRRRGNRHSSQQVKFQ